MPVAVTLAARVAVMSPRPLKTNSMMYPAAAMVV